jgi:hypothetical protein
MGKSKLYHCCSFPWFSIGYDPTGRGIVYKHLWQCQKALSLMETLHFDHTGPMIRYDRAQKTLHVADLNPQMETRWHMGRLDMLRTGWRFIKQALRP